MKISLLEWKVGHIWSISTPSDAYYTKLVNRIYDYLCFDTIDPRFTIFDLREIALSIGYYFEDVISDLGIWRTFVTLHKELYGSYLPFYEINEEEYLLDEINLEDVNFLLWLGVQQHCENTIVNPENPGLTALANQLYNFLDKEFDKAPINTKLLKEMLHPRYFANFYMLKEWCCQLQNSTYIFQDTNIFAHENEIEVNIKRYFGENDSVLGYTINSILSLRSKIGPLAMTTPQWLARYLKLKGMDSEADITASIECLPATVYLLKKYDAEQVTLQSAEGNKYLLDRNSFSELLDSTLDSSKTFMASLARSNSSPLWQVCGGSLWMASDEDFCIIKNEHKRRVETRKIILNKVLAANDNYPLLYFKDYCEMKQAFDTYLGLSEEFVDLKEMEHTKLIAMFIHSNGEICIMPGQAANIKDPRNPYYDQQKADKEALSLIFAPKMITSEAAHYLVAHNLLPDARINSVRSPERGRQLVQKNIDFWMRIGRKWDY